MIAWLMIDQGCTHDYWEKKPDNLLILEYNDHCEEGAE
jgi:hypothetical protein